MISIAAVTASTNKKTLLFDDTHDEPENDKIVERLTA